MFILLRRLSCRLLRLTSSFAGVEEKITRSIVIKPKHRSHHNQQITTRTEQQHQHRNSASEWVSVHATWFRSMVEWNNRKFIFLRCAFGAMNDSIQIASKITDDLIEYKLLAVMNIFFFISSEVAFLLLLLFFVKRFSFQLKVPSICLCVAFIKQISRSETLLFSFSFPFVCYRIQLGYWTNSYAEKQKPKIQCSKRATMSTASLPVNWSILLNVKTNDEPN